MLADATLTVTGVQGFFIVLAAVLFLIAAITARFAPVWWPVCVSAGLLFFVLTYLIH